jgi:hypothetical protein
VVMERVDERAQGGGSRAHCEAGHREQGTGNWVQGTGNREQGGRWREQGGRWREQRTGNREQGTGNRERGTGNQPWSGRFLRNPAVQLSKRQRQSVGTI